MALGVDVRVSIFRASLSSTIFTRNASGLGKVSRDSIAHLKFSKHGGKLYNNIMVNRSLLISTSISVSLSRYRRIDLSVHERLFRRPFDVTSIVSVELLFEPVPLTDKSFVIFAILRWRFRSP